MKVKCKERPAATAELLLRRAGYGKQTTRKGEVSYVRRLSPYDFPRFHIYVEEDRDPVTLSIHLDQKAPTYEGFSAHSGEYEGPLLEEELMRVRDVFGVQFILLLKRDGRPA